MRRSFVLTFVASVLSLVAPQVRAQVSLDAVATQYTQSFDGLPASGAAMWTNNSTIPGWFHARTGTGTLIVANSGWSNAGSFYSYGDGTATDRALGSLGSGLPEAGSFFWGVWLRNNTGVTITSLYVSYTGEQWRNSSAGPQTVAFSYLVDVPITGSLTEFQSAGVAVPPLDFTSPISGGALASGLDGNLATNRATRRFTITGLSIPPGGEVMLRWSDPDQLGADHGLSIDDFSVVANPEAGFPDLNVSDVTQAEGDAGTTTFTFTVSLTQPAGPGGVTFDIATADGTARDDSPVTEDNDYVAKSLTGQTIPATQTSYTFTVTVNGDTTPEANETFFVNVTNVLGAIPVDGQGQGVIENDDVTLIHDIQGPGAGSPISGSVVTVRGIVTGLKGNGYFVQETEASVDADPSTSEGIFVFTSSAPPAAAAVGNLVQVTGTVSEFVPSSDPLQPPLTQLTSPTTVLLSMGNPVPAAVPLTASFPDPAGAFDQLERLEGMRVSVASLTVSGPTLGNSVNEPNATQTSNGVFFGTVTGVARPFREPGIQDPDPSPSGSIPPIPRFDSNPELLCVDSDGVGGAILDVGAGAVVTGLVGPLDYTLRRYTLLPDASPAPPPVASGGPTVTPAAMPTSRELTIASYNLERFFDTVDDPGIGEPVLTAAAFDNRLNKASLAIRNYLRMPDVLGVVEVENLSTLQALAARISADAVAASQPDPQYAAFLEEGYDVGGIDVGFLVKTAPVAGASPRVTVNAVVQENAGVFVNLDSSTAVLNDRPPLRLEAVVNHANGTGFPVTVIVNHLRSLNGANDIAAGSSGWVTEGDRVRDKRQKQAQSLANLVQARQSANPAERIVLVGDFNAFEFNDGLVDSMNVIQGTPSPDDETAVPFDGVDLVNPDLDNLVDTPPPAERYSYVFDGQAQNLDQVLVNAGLVAATVRRRVEHPRINADFPAVDRNDPSTPRRLSDHDPVVGYFEVAGFTTADLSITKVDGPDPVTAGTSLAYTITVTNDGPDSADNVFWSDTLPAGTTFVSLASPGGWSCTTPPPGGSGAVFCSINRLAVSSAAFTLTVAVAPSIAAGAVLSNTASAISTTADPDTGDLTATATTTVTTSADLAITKTDGTDPIAPGGIQTYTITVTNGGPSDASNVGWSDLVPPGTQFLSVTAPGGWNCMGFSIISCNSSSLAFAGSAVFTMQVRFHPALGNGHVAINEVGVFSSTPDGQVGDNDARADTTVAPRTGGFFPLTPCRLADTRQSSPLQNGVPRTFALHGVCGIPATATTVVLNLTAAAPGDSGNVTVHPSDEAPSPIPALHFANRARASIAFARISRDAAGELVVQAAVGNNGSVHLVMDVTGYFE